jgi:MFS family permease
MQSGSRYKWQVVGMLWCICLLNYADRQAIFSVFPLLEKEMNLTPVQLGMLGSAFAWVYGLGAPLAGLVVDRIRRTKAILGGLHAWSIICAVTGASTGYWQLLFFRAAEGLGETFYYPASVSLLSDYHGKDTRSRALGIHQTSVYIGTIAGGFFAGFIGQHYGWRWSFIIFGGLGIVLGFILRRSLREPVRGAADHLTVTQVPPREALRMILSTPTALMLMAAFVCANFVAVVLLAWMPKFLYERFGMSLAAAGLSATLFAQLSSMAGAFTGGFLADRWVKKTVRGRVAVQLLGVLVGAPFVVLCGLTQSVGWLIVALSGWGFFKGLYDANIFASVFDVIRPEARGATAGLMNCVGWLLGGGIAPIVVGFLAQQIGLGAAIAAASGVYLLAAACLLTAMTFFLRRDVARLAQEPRSPNFSMR